MEEEGRGEGVEAIAYTREDRQRYREKVQQDLDVFEQMLTHHSFDYERPLTGMEIELSLVDEDYQPRMNNAAVLERIADPRYQTELSQYNIELKAEPRTVMPEHFEADWMSANMRYAALNEAMVNARGEDMFIDIQGASGERVARYADSIGPESAGTSVQLHLQVPRRSSPRTGMPHRRWQAYSWRQEPTHPSSTASNSGTRHVSSSSTRPLTPARSCSRTRACGLGSSSVKAGVLPAGPTIIHTMANSAFYLGVLGMLAEDDRPIWTQLSFSAAEQNFHACARQGMAALVYWPAFGRVPADELVLRHLLPMAHEGLEHWGISSGVRDRYLGVIEARCTSGVTGAVPLRPRPASPHMCVVTVWQGRGMASDPHRTVTITRTSAGRYTAVNGRGGKLDFGTGDVEGFTPVELLLVAIGGCSAVDVDIFTTRRAEPVSFVVEVGGDKVRDEGGNRMEDLSVSFRLTFPEGEGGDAARALVPEAVQRSHDRLCSVSRTVELGTPVAMRIEP
jgi:uncharacterized OsmC-like protein